MVRINWTAQSVLDLKDISDYIARNSPYYARITILKIQQKTEILERFIEAGSVIPETNLPTIRHLVEGNYRIIYEIINPEEVNILTVHHAARDLNKRIK